MVPTRPAHAGVDDTACSLQTLGILGIHAQTMENRRTFARLLSHMLPFYLMGRLLDVVVRVVEAVARLGRK